MSKSYFSTERIMTGRMKPSYTGTYGNLYIHSSWNKFDKFKIFPEYKEFDFTIWLIDLKIALNTITRMVSKTIGSFFTPTK